MMEITTGTNIDSSIRGLDAGEVELRAWWGKDGSSLVWLHPLGVGTGPQPMQGKARASPPTGVTQGAEGPGATLP